MHTSSQSEISADNFAGVENVSVNKRAFGGGNQFFKVRTNTQLFGTLCPYLPLYIINSFSSSTHCIRFVYETLSSFSQVVQRLQTNWP